MRNAGTRCRTVLLLLSICGAACSRSERPKELVALDNAYSAGLLNRDDYQAKKAALESVAPALVALDKAFEAGILTKQDSDARKAALVSKAGALAALEQAFKAGILSTDEYAGKKAALLAAGVPGSSSTVAQNGTPNAPMSVATPAPKPIPALVTTNRAPAPPLTPAPAVQPFPAQAKESSAPVPNTPASANQFAPTQANASQSQANLPQANQAQANQANREGQKPAAAAGPSPAAPASGADGHSYRLKMASIADATGFERPMTSISMLIPTDWQSQGATTWNIKDNCNTIQSTLHASGPEGRGYDLFPAYIWTWADDPKPLQQIFAQKAQLGAHACDVMPPMGAADFLRRNLARIRPNAQLVGIEPTPKLMQILQQQARQTEQSAAQYRLQQRVRPDVVRGRVRYSLNGKPVEEWIIVATVITGTLGPSFNIATGQQTQAFSYSCLATVVAERAPQGQLDASEKFFELINSTVRVNPQWQSRVNGNALAIQQIELKGVRDRSAIVSKNADDIAKIQRHGYENQQKSEDHVFQQFSENTRGVETYRNPTSGETIELSNQYGHAWVNNRGEYLLSDQEGFDPSVTFKEDWTPLQHVKP